MYLPLQVHLKRTALRNLKRISSREQTRDWALQMGYKDPTADIPVAVVDGCRLLGRSPPNTDQRTDGSRAKLRSSHPGDNRGAAVVRAIVPATEEEAMTVEWRWWWPCLELVQPRRCLVDALCHLLGMLKQC